MMNVNTQLERRQVAVGCLRLEGLEMSQDVKQYKDIPARRLMPYRMRRAVSPHEFYLELTNFPEHRLYNNWYPKMQAFYEHPNNQAEMQLFKGTPLPGRCYACKDFVDGKWHRVRLHKAVNKPSASVLTVFYLDLCKLQETEAKNLLELHPNFAQFPAQVFRCYLSDVNPAGTDGDSSGWSERACNYFQDLVKSKQYIGVVLARSDVLVTEEMPDFITNLGVVLVESLPGTRTPKPKVCSLNAQLIDAGFAAAIGICAGCKHALEKGTFVPFFDHEEFDTRYPPDPRNNFTSAFEQVAEAANGSAERHLNRDADMVVSNGRRFEETERGGVEAYYKNTTDCLPVEIAGQLAGVNLVYVVNPSHIIVHLVSKQAELNRMQEGVRRMVEENAPLVDGQPGTLVACKIIDFMDNRVESAIWCRGILMRAVKKENAESYKILLVDYGNLIEVDSAFVRHLPSYFAEMPSFAVRVHLDVEDLAPATSQGFNGLTVTSSFRRYLLAWADKEPSYFMYFPCHAQVLQLKYYGQRVKYNSKERKWCVNGDKRPPSIYNFLSELKDHPMMHNLLVSVGVEIHYELFVPQNNFWYFTSISDFLEESGHARKFQRKKTGARLHCDIVQAARSNLVEQRHVAEPCTTKL